MFRLKDTKTGQFLLNREGKPFEYSTRALAQLGKTALEAKLDTKITVSQSK